MLWRVELHRLEADVVVRAFERASGQRGAAVVLRQFCDERRGAERHEERVEPHQRAVLHGHVAGAHQTGRLQSAGMLRDAQEQAAGQFCLHSACVAGPGSDSVHGPRGHMHTFVLPRQKHAAAALHKHSYS